MVKKICLTVLSCLLVVFSVFSLNLNFSNYDLVSAEEETVTDLTGFQWYANETLSFGTEYFKSRYSINGLWGISYNTLTSNFIVSDYSFRYYAFRGLSVSLSSTYGSLDYFSSTSNSISQIYNDSNNLWSGFSDMEKRYFLFLGGTDTTNSDLISWLSLNGTLSYVGTTEIIEHIVNNAILNPVVYVWNDFVSLSTVVNNFTFTDVFYYINDNVLSTANILTVDNNNITYSVDSSSSLQVYNFFSGWLDTDYKVLYFPITYNEIESYFDDSLLYNFMLNNGSFLTYNAYNYNQGYEDGFFDAYNDGYNQGLAYASNMYYGFGPFLYSSWSIVNKTDYSEVLGGFTGRFTSDNFNAFNGGFTFSSELYNAIEEYFLENEEVNGVFKVNFDNYLPISLYADWVTYNFTFGNELTFILNNGSKIYFNNESITKSISLSDYSNYSIVSVIVSFASSFSDYGDFGLGTNANYMNAYQNGYGDGYNLGKSDGYLSGFNTGKAKGYNDGLNAANEYTFFSLISAVVDAPIQAFTSLFNFNVLGVNILSLITGLFTLLLVVVVVKILMGGK